MKTLTLFILALATAVAAGAQSWKPNFGANYGFTLPTGGMKQYIRNGNGLSMHLLMEAPSHRIAAGAEFNLTGYGHSRSSQNYTFADGTQAPMDVVVNNSFMNFMAVARLYLVADGPVRPYATVKGGYTQFRTQLTIVDPDDEDSCKPVESDKLSRDGTFSYSAGAGVRIDLGWFSKKIEKGSYFIDLSSNILQGGRVNYMNEDAPDPSGHTMASTRSRGVEAEFINTETQVVHRHHVGYMYNSFVQMVDFRLGFSMNFR